MTRLAACWMLGLALTSVVACQHEAKKDDWKSFAPPSSSTLDGMQLASARRVAIESATAAMRSRDLERLKQLGTWVRGRAQVAILDQNDLDALDSAIACLEQPASAADTLARVQGLSSGRLKQPAQTLCETSSPR